MPLCSLVSEHAEVSIADVIYHVIRGGHVETLAEPIDCQVTGCHGIEQKILQVLQGLGRGKEVVCHVDIIGTGSDALGQMVDTAPTGTRVCYINLQTFHRTVECPEIFADQTDH